MNKTPRKGPSSEEWKKELGRPYRAGGEPEVQSQRGGDAKFSCLAVLKARHSRGCRSVQPAVQRRSCTLRVQGVPGRCSGGVLS